MSPETLLKDSAEHHRQGDFPAAIRALSAAKKAGADPRIVEARIQAAQEAMAESTRGVPVPGEKRGAAGGRQLYLIFMVGALIAGLASALFFRLMI